MGMEKVSDAVAAEWVEALKAGGMTDICAKQLGNYIGGVEARIADLKMRVSKLEKGPAITVNGQKVRK